MVEQRDTNQSHLRMMLPPGIDPADAEQRAAMVIYTTLLGGSMGSRLFDEIREQRGLCYSSGPPSTRSPTSPSSGSARAWSPATR
jgi:predicted Zn-dependent peptidase